MRKWIPQFWYSPTKRYRIAIISFIACIASFYGILSIDIHSHLYIYLALAFTALISFFLVFTFYTFGQLKEIGQDFHSFLKTSERNAVYDYYQLKHKEKDYKGPLWEDEEFAKITNLKQRIDAFVKTSIEYQQVDFKRWKKRNVGVNLDTWSQTIFRSFWILCATTISILFLFYLDWFEYLSADNLKNLSDISRGFFTIPVALIGTIVAAPIIFMVWLFRDKNNRIQIENARKDTNLKDFQKLSEWASGFHLPEIKQTTSTKTTNKTAKDVQEHTEEITSSQEDFIAPEGSNSISRRQGAEALQASAIAQLEAFMFGKYGEQFMQPAFLLIHAIWESIIVRYQAQLEEDFYFRNYLHILSRTPVVSSLNKALIGTRGMHLKLFEEQLININLTALNTNSSLFRINLSGYTLIGANLSFTNFCNCIFSGADLTRGNIKYALLKSASLQKAILNFAEASNANLSHSNLQSASLHNANLQSADLWGADLQLANLSGSQLKGANLKAAIFKDTDFEFASLNRKTQFGDDDLGTSEDKIRENVLSRGAIWDDDPTWLVDKIQDKALLEKIFQDCKER
ncbi:pentapeptide repeat-containing protein [Alkanindiges illinoisensis]|uniref:pentapeptide repeat-containing protein n=1 Tax=Alkanindiges illinoisensis TaxID=197183 RepID=UPI0006848797|nr:pentapeptide repeat-containing protein [Alkanindiges illinoisensis]